MKEFWKDIKEYEGLYQVSNLGNIKSLKRYVNTKNGAKRLVKEKILKPVIDNTNYYIVSLWKNNICQRTHIHRLVIETFINNSLNKPCVNHIDGNTLNNCVNNLEWCTYSENALHCCYVLQKNVKKVNQYDLNGNFIKQWSSIKEAQKFYKTTHISECCNSNSKRCITKGFLWKYADE